MKSDTYHKFVSLLISEKSFYETYILKQDSNNFVEKFKLFKVKISIRSLADQQTLAKNSKEKCPKQNKDKSEYVTKKSLRG